MMDRIAVAEIAGRFARNLLRKADENGVVQRALVSERGYGGPSGTRTQDPLIKSQMLYRPELTAHRGDARGLFDRLDP